jgi:squalene-hopene/tetraprenyl-beta-curcumene cyclase
MRTVWLAVSLLCAPLSVSALSLVREHASEGTSFQDEIAGGLRWLAAHQNDDGGWGDTDKSHSNIATTMLVFAAFHLADQAAAHGEQLARAQQYIDQKGGVDGVLHVESRLSWRHDDEPQDA